MKLKKLTKKQFMFNMLLSIYVCVMLLDESNFIVYTRMNMIITFAKLFVLCGLILYFFRYQNHIKKDATFYLLVTLLCTNLIGMIRSGTEINILLFIGFILASYKNELENVYKVFLWIFCITILIVIISSKIGIIEDIINIRYGEDFFSKIFFQEGKYIRHSFGFLNNNQIAFYLMTIYIMLFALKREKLKWYFHFLIQVLNIIVFVYCGSRFVFAIIILMDIAYYIIPKMDRKIQNLIISIGKYAFIIFSLLSILTVIEYKKIPFSVDAFFNFRFTYAYRVIQKNGIHLLGSGLGINVPNVGNGNYEYEVLDNGYLVLLVQRGIIFGSILILLWSKAARKAAKKHNIYFLIALLALACENFIDYQILSFKFVPLLFFLYNPKDLILQKNDKKEKIYKENEKSI